MVYQIMNGTVKTKMLSIHLLLKRQQIIWMNQHIGISNMGQFVKLLVGFQYLCLMLFLNYYNIDHMQTQNRDSAEEQYSSKRRIKFSQQIPSLHLQVSVPSLQYPQPVSILKRKRYSLTQADLEHQDPSLLKHSYSETKIPPLPRKFVFKIQSPVKIQRQTEFIPVLYQSQKPVKNIEERVETAQNKDIEIVQSTQSRGPRKLPVWLVLVLGMVGFVILGWIVSRMFFTKIKAKSQHKQQQIFNKYLKDLTDYQVRNIKLFKPLSLRKDTWLWNMTKGSTLTDKKVEEKKQKQLEKQKDKNGVKLNDTFQPIPFLRAHPFKVNKHTKHYLKWEY